MLKLERTSPFTTLIWGVVGLVAGFVTQVVRSGSGKIALVPPLSLGATLIVLGAILIVLGILLHRAVTRESDRLVNPFHAVRLLAASRASQFVGALFAGFSGGLALQLLTRSVPAPTATWAPMIFVVGSGIVLLVCGIIAESLCRVPPENPDAPGNQGEAGTPSGTERPA